MAILGLLVQREDTTAGIGVRLSELFPRARWPRNAVHGNLPSLVKQGLVHIVAKGSGPALDHYEATTEGIMRFRAWVSESVDLPPAIRDGLQARLQFIEPHDLYGLVEMVRKSEDACSMEYSAAHRRLKAATRQLHRSVNQPIDWRSKLQLIQIGDEAIVWGTMARRLQLLGDELEELYRETSGISDPLEE